MGAEGHRLSPRRVACVLAETRPEWVYADLGILGAGGVSGGIHPRRGGRTLRRRAAQCGCRVLFVENEEQLDKVLLVRDRCPALQRIVIFDMKGLRDFADPMCESLAALRRARREHDRRTGDWQAGIAAISRAAGGAAAAAGSRRKGRMLTHGDALHLIANARSTAGAARRRRTPGAAADVQRDGARAGPVSGARCARGQQLSGKPGHCDENLQEVQPTVLGADPADLAAAACARERRRRRRHAPCSGCCIAGRSPRAARRLAGSAGASCVLHAVRRELGLSRLRRRLYRRGTAAARNRAMGRSARHHHPADRRPGDAGHRRGRALSCPDGRSLRHLKEGTTMRSKLAGGGIRDRAGRSRHGGGQRSVA